MPGIGCDRCGDGEEHRCTCLNGWLLCEADGCDERATRWTGEMFESTAVCDRHTVSDCESEAA